MYRPVHDGLVELTGGVHMVLVKFTKRKLEIKKEMRARVKRKDRIRRTNEKNFWDVGLM